MKFVIEQIALNTGSARAAQHFLGELGLVDWVSDHVCAQGEVFGEFATNEADLHFNYQAGAKGNLELEILDYDKGPNWLRAAKREISVSHLGMHVTEEELKDFAAIMKKYGVRIAQEVTTTSHTNPVIKDTRRYKYVIYDTRPLIGVDLKFIVRIPL
jgi:hypothetical protein